tara:strand:+ start:77 stop:307 length:231 start_codon:yes stop_codon:yes gene_type:complete
MTKKSDWEILAEKEQAIREKAIKALTEKQIETIKEAHKTIGACLDMLFECQDLYLSDMHKLNNVYWAIKNQFNLEK